MTRKGLICLKTNQATKQPTDPSKKELSTKHSERIKAKVSIISLISFLIYLKLCLVGNVTKSRKKGKD